MSPRVEVGAATDVGRVRETNEDALLALPLGGGPRGPVVLVAVADGMGGHAAGEVASALALETVAEQLQRTASGGEQEPVAACLERAVLAANRAIWNAAAADPERAGMGTTLVCALVDATGEASIANIGDSRAYLVSGQEARQVTEDHSLVAEMVRAGRMTEEEAQTHPYRNVLSRSLGVEPAVQVDLYTGLHLRTGDMLVLCSDGVSTYLRTAELPALVRQTLSAQDAAERLVELALNRGGHDNATAVVARIAG